MLELKEGRVPQLDELRLHNGTIWRWNRPVYDVAGGVPHVRVENRVLPAGPTAVDMVANALLFYGLLRELVEAERPLWSSMSFEAAQENFTTAARHGLDGPLYWPGSGWIRPDELVLRKLLPQAADGLARWGVAASVIDRYLTRDRAALPAPAHGRGVAARRGRGAGAARRGPGDGAARHVRPLPGALRGQRAGAHLAAAARGVSRSHLQTVSRKSGPPGRGRRS